MGGPAAGEKAASLTDTQQSKGFLCIPPSLFISQTFVANETLITAFKICCTQHSNVLYPENHSLALFPICLQNEKYQLEIWPLSVLTAKP